VCERKVYSAEVAESSERGAEVEPQLELEPEVPVAHEQGTHPDPVAQLAHPLPGQHADRVPHPEDVLHHLLHPGQQSLERPLHALDGHAHFAPDLHGEDPHRLQQFLGIEFYALLTLHHTSARHSVAGRDFHSEQQGRYRGKQPLQEGVAPVPE